MTWKCNHPSEAGGFLGPCPHCRERQIEEARAGLPEYIAAHPGILEEIREDRAARPLRVRSRFPARRESGPCECCPPSPKAAPEDACPKCGAAIGEDRLLCEACRYEVQEALDDR